MGVGSPVGDLTGKDWDRVSDVCQEWGHGFKLSWAYRSSDSGRIESNPEVEYHTENFHNASIPYERAINSLRAWQVVDICREIIREREAS